MGFRSSALLCLALVLAVSSAIHAFDVTKLLGQYPEFATFNKYLTETKLAEQINSRNTITVLAVDDGALGALSGKSPQATKAILSTHVILDYFDEKKLFEAQGSSQQLTTLYQASGLAVNQQGFLKVALIGEGAIAFSSASSGAQADAELVKTVTTEPYNISILQVSKLIVVPGVDSQSPASPSNAQPPAATKAPAGGAKSPTPAAAAAAQSAKAPVAAASQAPVAASQGAKAPAPAKAAQAPAQVTRTAQAPAQAAQAPALAKEEVTAPTTAGESVTESPAEAPETTAASPVVAEGPAPGPVEAEAGAADAAAPSSSSRTTIGLVGAVMGFTSLLVVL